MGKTYTADSFKTTSGDDLVTSKLNVKDFYFLLDFGSTQPVYLQGKWDIIGSTTPTSNTNRICTVPFLIKKGATIDLTFDIGLQYGISYFNDDLTLAVAAPIWITSNTSILGSNYNYVALSVSYVNGTNLTPSTPINFVINGQRVLKATNLVQNLGSEDDSVISQKIVSQELGKVLNSNVTIPNYTISAFSNDNPFNVEANLLYKKAVLQKNSTSNTHDLIIVAGQSNADGRIPKASAPSWLVSSGYTIANYMMWKPSTGTFESYNLDTNNGSYGDNPSCFSFDIFFAKSYLDANPTKKLYCIKQTVGGVPITELGFTGGGNRYYRWQPKTNLIVSGDLSMCDALLVKLNNALTYGLSKDIKLKPIAILYHQGEGDADRATDGGITAYKQNLSNLLSWFRGLFSAPTLPFLNGYIVGTYNVNYPLINNIYDEMMLQDAYMKTVDMTSHYTTLDGIHYNSSALEYMASQMYANYLTYNF